MATLYHHFKTQCNVTFVFFSNEITAHTLRWESVITIDKETATLTPVKAIILSFWYHALLLC